MKIKKPRVFLSKELEGHKNPLRVSLQELNKFAETPEYIFWLCHGINFINSNAKEAIWNPVFEFIYEEDKTMLNKCKLKHIIRAIEIKDLDAKSALWAVQPPLIMYELSRFSEMKPELRLPANSEIWTYFDTFISNLNVHSKLSLEEMTHFNQEVKQELSEIVD
jgi:hypothetical protein